MTSCERWSKIYNFTMKLLSIRDCLITWRKFRSSCAELKLSAFRNVSNGATASVVCKWIFRLYGPMMICNFFFLFSGRTADQNAIHYFGDADWHISQRIVTFALKLKPRSVGFMRFCLRNQRQFENMLNKYMKNNYNCFFFAGYKAGKRRSKTTESYKLKVMFRCLCGASWPSIALLIY